MQIRIDLHIHKHGEQGQGSSLQQKELERIMADLTALTASVAHNTDVAESAVLAIQGLKAQLDAAGTDPAALAALSAQLGATDDALSAAIVATNPTAAAAAVAKAKAAVAALPPHHRHP